jgi:hypothetical protein
MSRCFKIAVIFIFFGFSHGRQSLLCSLFYDIPLDKDKFTIDRFLKTDPNFTAHTPDSLFANHGLRIVTVKKVRPLQEPADSATIELSHTFMPIAGFIGTRLHSLNEITLTLYFKTASSRDVEFEAVKQVLTDKFKRINHPENNVEFEYALTRRQFPLLQLTLDNLSKEHPYFTIRYYGISKQPMH